MTGRFAVRITCLKLCQENCEEGNVCFARIESGRLIMKDIFIKGFVINLVFFNPQIIVFAKSLQLKDIRDSSADQETGHVPIRTVLRMLAHGLMDSIHTSGMASNVGTKFVKGIVYKLKLLA